MPSKWMVMVWSRVPAWIAKGSMLTEQQEKARSGQPTRLQTHTPAHCIRVFDQENSRIPPGIAREFNIGAKHSPSVELNCNSGPPALFYKKPSSIQHNSPTRAFHPSPKKTIGLQYMTIHAISSDLPSACTCAAQEPSKSATARPCKMRKIWKFEVHLKCHQQWRFEAKMHSLPPEMHF